MGELEARLLELIREQWYVVHNDGKAFADLVGSAPQIPLEPAEANLLLSTSQAIYRMHDLFRIYDSFFPGSPYVGTVEALRRQVNEGSQQVEGMLRTLLSAKPTTDS